MAESPAHRFGQVVGDLLESIVRPQLEKFCASNKLYLDHQKRSRPARVGKKVSWVDKYGNSHDLDFVIERDGTDECVGRPVAFIETAWRRYTKHSRNKAQEIQGAILPLAETHRWNNPFLGAVLAGEFTEASLEQLRSQGFRVLHFSYDSLVAAFASQGIDIHFDESTPDSVFLETTARIVAATPDKLQRISSHLINSNHSSIRVFFQSMSDRLSRQVTKVVIIPLYGKINEFVSIEAAVDFLGGHSMYEGSGEFRKYEIRIEFSNGDKIDASMSSKQKAKEFLEFVVRQ